ncbi:MAG: Hsp33 family molecular chaperone HslO [Bradymonadia bacterium]
MSEPTTDNLHRFISLDHSFRVVAAVNTEVVREACLRHNITGLAAVALGRALTAAQLMATLGKNEERITIQIRGSGPLRGIVVDAWSNGGARGYVTEPVQVTPPEGRIWLYKLVGRQGTVTVQRDVGLKDIYQGTRELVQGEVDEDIEGYLRNSEQIPSALGCDVILDEAAGQSHVKTR